jgi:hypothetical protein
MLIYPCSPIHDHGHSASWFKILQGELRVTEYKDDQPTQVSTLSTDTVTFFPGMNLFTIAINIIMILIYHILLDDFPRHKTENASSTNTAISLHVYSPPYFECKVGNSIVPVVYCSSISCTEGRRNSKSDCNNLSTNKDHDQGDLDVQISLQRTVFSNFQSLVDVLRKEFQSKNPCSKKVKHIMQSLQFHPKYCNEGLQYRNI